MSFIPSDPTTWPLKVKLIAHDVGRSHDRSTAVVGGNCPFTVGRGLLAVKEFVELPAGLYGSALANALAEIDRTHSHDCLIVADLSNEASYGEILFDTFGRRVIGVQIGRSGDGMTSVPRPVRHGFIPVYNVGRTFLLELLHVELQDGRVLFASGEEGRRAYEQLAALEVEQRESGTVYKCPSGQHDDLAMSVAMLAWAAQHLHLDSWTRPIFDAHRPRRSRQTHGWGAFT